MRMRNEINFYIYLILTLINRVNSSPCHLKSFWALQQFRTAFSVDKSFAYSPITSELDGSVHLIWLIDCSHYLKEKIELNFR